MTKRPDIHKMKDPQEFRNYYYLLSELKAFCKETGLPSSGSKDELTERIHLFLKTGETLTPVKKAVKSKTITTTTPDTVIEENIKCSEVHRAFFKEIIGPGFGFNVAFQKWLKENSGKTYSDAVAAY